VWGEEPQPMREATVGGKTDGKLGLYDKNKRD